MSLNYDLIYTLLRRQIVRYNDAKIVTRWLGQYFLTSNTMLITDGTLTNI